MMGAEGLARATQTAILNANYLAACFKDTYVYEVIQFGKAFALRGFYHQRAVNGEGEGRRMIAVVHQSLGDVVFADARFLVHLAALQYHFTAR